MPLHPQAKQVVDTMAAMGVSLGGDPVAVRALMSSFPRPEGEEVANVEDRNIPGPAGEIPVRIYTPLNAAGVLPCLVWYHGGGWVIGNLDGADNSCRSMANASGCKVVSVDYRLAPEHRFPAAADDSFAALEWVANNAASLGIDANRIAVGGDSAGGNLAAVVSQMARDAGGPNVVFQVLIYPVTDVAMDTGSYSANAEGYLLTRDSMVWFWGHYLHTNDGTHPKASPIRHENLAGLPPAIVITAEFDPLRDEGEAYAKAMQDAGVKVQVKRYDGQIHGFYGNPVIDDGGDALRLASKALKDAVSAVPA
jgi:acetyl esterase